MSHIIAFMNDATPTVPFSRSTAVVSRKPPVASARLCGKVADEVGGSAQVGVATEEVRMDRVNALRAAIAEGSYKVSAADLADRILHAMLQK